MMDEMDKYKMKWTEHTNSIENTLFPELAWKYRIMWSYELKQDIILQVKLDDDDFYLSYDVLIFSP